MKRMTRVLVITAVSTLLLGVTLMVIGAAVVGFQWERLLTDQRVKHLTEITKPFDSIDLAINIDSIELLPSEGDQALVECYESDRSPYVVSVNKRCLTIRQEEHQQWYEFISLHIPTKRSLRIFLPSDTYRKISVKTHIGDITIADSFRIEELSVSADIGTVKVPKAIGAQTNGANIHVGIGNVTIQPKQTGETSSSGQETPASAADTSDSANIHTGIGDVTVHKNDTSDNNHLRIDAGIGNIRVE